MQNLANALFLIATGAILGLAMILNARDAKPVVGPSPTPVTAVPSPAPTLEKTTKSAKTKQGSQSPKKKAKKAPREDDVLDYD